MTFTKYSTIFAITLLSACGNSGSSTDTTAPIPEPLTLPTARFDQSELVNRSIMTDAVSSGQMITQTADLPTTGTANYGGYISLSAADPNLTVINPATTPDFRNVFGEIVLRADFNDSTITGIAGNFRHPNPTKDAVSGTITLTDGVIGDQNGQAGYNANFDGTLTEADDTIVTIDGRINGTFRNGDNGNALGVTTANIRGTGIVNGETERLDGSIVAEQQ